MKPQNRLSRWLHWLVRAYQLVLSPYLGGRCRFVPSCSNFALQCFEEMPAGRAALVSFQRICRCHPLGGHGYDPVSLHLKKPNLRSLTKELS